MHKLKAVGYLISTISVVLLAIVSWSSASAQPLLMACLVGGAATSIIGMFCRFLADQMQARRDRQQERELSALRSAEGRGGSWQPAR